MEQSILAVTINQQVLLPQQPEKDEKHRLSLFIRWLAERGIPWFCPDLAAYRDYLLDEYPGQNQTRLSPSSVQTHLATVRGRYTALLRDNRIRDQLYAAQPNSTSPSDRKALVDEILQRLRNEIDPHNLSVPIIVKRDRADNEQLRLTTQEANALLVAPGLTSLMGLRDTALIALMLCTGIREAEACALDASDLRQQLGGELALQIRAGKGLVQRLIPYGQLQWVLVIVDKWLELAEIASGAVFRGFYKGARHIRPTRLTVRAVNQILDKYPIAVGDDPICVVKPHDLRRTYARRLYEAGVDLVAIRDNLGHSDSKTTLHYIGALGVDARRPPAVYSFDLRRLGQVRRENLSD